MADLRYEITCFGPEFYEAQVLAMAEFMVAFGPENLDFSYPRLVAAIAKYHESRGGGKRG